MGTTNLPDRLRFRRLLPLLVVASMAITVVLVPVDARAESVPATYHPIAQRAMQDALTFQGQCWTWMRQIVQESTGRTMGFGYVSGFYEAGATEVPLSEARQGDIIQVADDQNAGPGVDYPGLHTGLVLEAFGDGTFTIIDSNSQWDGIVRLRYDYDPQAAAGRYAGLEIHAYRIPLDGSDVPAGQPSPGPSPQPTEAPVADDFGVGDSAIVTTDSGCLNLRDAPSLSGTGLGCLAQGSRLVVLSEVIHADGWAWVAVNAADGQSGWVASEYLSAAEPAPPPGPNVDPSPTAASEEADVDPDPTHRAVMPLLAVS